MHSRLERLMARSRGSADRGGAMRLRDTGLADSDYANVVQSIEGGYASLGEWRHALGCALYVAMRWPDPRTVLVEYLPHLEGTDRAYALAMVGDRRAAADVFDQAGRFASAAREHELGGDPAAARRSWARLVSQTRSDLDDYTRALGTFNLARVARQAGDDKAADEALDSATGLIERAASEFERAGFRERAFDCFQTLIEIGREGDRFEDMLEGYVNTTRILREDHLTNFALSTYDEALASARARGELGAAAAIAREAASFARQTNRPERAGTYLRGEAELFFELGRLHAERGQLALSENARLSAADKLAGLEQYASVRAIFAELAESSPEPKRREAYARAAVHFEGARNMRRLPEAPLLTAPSAPTEAVWIDDIIEWETRDAPEDVCAALLVDHRWPSAVRRRALVARLSALSYREPRERAHNAPEDAGVTLARDLVKLELYSGFGALEELYRGGSTTTRVAVCQGLGSLYFKRSFVTLRQAAMGSEEPVALAACESIAKLAFPHAVDPLTRLLRESTRPELTAAALTALAQVDTDDAALAVLGKLEHGSESERRMASDALRGARAERWVALARERLRVLDAETRARIEREIVAAS